MDSEDRRILKVAAGAITAALAFLALVHCSVRQPARAANPPMLVLLEGEAFATLPDGELVRLPAGSSIPACRAAGAVTGDLPEDSPRPALVQDRIGRVVRVVSPCVGIFSDGFEFGATP